MSASFCKPNEVFASNVTKVQFILRTGSERRQILLDCFPGETVLSVKERLGDIVGTDPALLRLIFCGQSLADGIRLSALELGPATFLTLTSAAPNATLSPSIGPSSLKCPIEACAIESGDDEGGWVKVTASPLAEKNSSGSEFSAFFVFCKCCASLERAKLRAYCRVCESSAIIFRKEPQRWDDVKENNSIRVFCHCCELETAVFFRFKCIKCGQCASPLQHISRNFSTPPSDCVVCGSNSASIGVRLRDCAHFSCVQCFVAYAKQLLSRLSLKWHPQVGYTVGCPVYGCADVVTDVHTLYLLGMSSYQHYQQMAAQLFFSAQVAERQHCPWPNCGAAFFVEETDGKSGDQKAEEVILCPECCRLFCLRCCNTNSGEAPCNCAVPRRYADTESASLIQRTTKNCPHCAAPTERNGGCAHIRCTQCQSEWCFVCLKLWSDDCQWDHWFE